MTFEEARAAFPVLERLAYLNAGSMGPLARATVDVMATRLRADLDDGRGGKAYIEEMLALRQRVRAALAAAISVDPDGIALMTSTTDACNAVLAGLELGPDDEVVTTDVEHFGLIGPLHASGARIRVAPVGTASGRDAAQAILDRVTAATRLIAVSHVAWTSGNSLSPALLKAETGLPVLVDGAQSVGAVEVDAAAFDFYTVSGQKWLCGPDTTGALYVADPERLRVARPTYFSQERYEPTGAFAARPGAQRFDSTWLGVPSLAGLETALRQAPDWRFERIRETAARCRRLLADRFEIVTAPDQAGLVSFRVPDPVAAVARAYERGVVLRDLPGTGLVRASCGYWTSDGDLERMLAAI
ncbi:MAG: aminotransferase class V-fold PLP-dependent enzyme [Gaiellaceae bacterium]